MKIALITDTHAGARNDNLVLDDYFRRFYSEVFFPYLDEHGIKTVFHLGDIFDRRKFINFNILSRVREYLFDQLKSRSIDFHLIVGNHDAFYKNTLDINSPDKLLQEYDFNLYFEPKEVQLGSAKIAALPWVCTENYEESMAFLKNSRANYLFGHLDIAGFEMHKGSIQSGGFEPSLFSKFDLVLSGHFHTKSRRGNIMYLGTPYQMTWADYNDPKGFHILDTETGDIEWIENPLTIFEKINYNDSGKTLDDLLEIPDLANKYVKVIVQTKENAYWYDIFIDKIEKMNPSQLTSIENSIFLGEDEEDFLDEIEDTVTILKKYCLQVESDTNKKRLESYMIKLYNEALEIQD